MTYRYSPGYDPRTIDGIKAVTTQPYTELNSKRGTQYEASFYLASLAVSTSTDIIITTVFAATERLVGEINVVVTDVGDATPAAGEANHIPFDGSYTRNADAVDIWMISPNGDTTIYGEGQ
ncbi:MAG: hypothetical protein GY766_00160 [Herbaspirillum sp.]|uniref:hypothetical protein n=1 Tax=Herbaspirillum sp. TaxID=1890675 RepID=UPI00258B36DA|nr:hypothetical protein [Herbaspirillum sp.]MCP3653295.1 hypothetical protein [Herbaspirillum sp.]